MSDSKFLNYFFQDLKITFLNEGINISDIVTIICHFLKISHSDFIILSRSQHSISDKEQGIIIAALDRLLRGEPLDYITNKSIFFNYEFYVNNKVLIPRVDSEILISEALSLTKSAVKAKTLTILDLCCGSGCLGISLYLELLKSNIKANVDFVDISEDALSVVQKNLFTHSIQDARTLWHDITKESFWSDTNKYDIILFNPPYIKTTDIYDLDISVKDHEPFLALNGGEDGLLFYKIFFQNLHKIKSTNDSKSFSEIGYNQKTEIINIMKQNNIKQWQVIKDYGHNDRCVIA